MEALGLQRWTLSAHAAGAPPSSTLPLLLDFIAWASDTKPVTSSVDVMAWLAPKIADICLALANGDSSSVGIRMTWAMGMPIPKASLPFASKACHDQHYHLPVADLLKAYTVNVSKQQVWIPTFTLKNCHPKLLSFVRL